MFDHSIIEISEVMIFRSKIHPETQKPPKTSNVPRGGHAWLSVAFVRVPEDKLLETIGLCPDIRKFLITTTDNPRQIPYLFFYNQKIALEERSWSKSFQTQRRTRYLFFFKSGT